MTTKELARCKEVLDYFDVDYASEEVILTDGGSSCLMNPKTPFSEFLGCSINGIAEAVAREMGKKTRWVSY